MYFALITLGITSSINFLYSMLLTLFIIVIFLLFSVIEKYYRHKKKFLHKISFSEGINFNYVEISTMNEQDVLSNNQFLIDEFFDSQNREHQYKFACPDRNAVQDIKNIINKIDKAKIISFNVRYN